MKLKTTEAFELWEAAQVAEVLGVSTGTLATWRSKRLGPPFLKLGKRICYTPSDVKAYLKRQRVATFELGRRLDEARL